MMSYIIVAAVSFVAGTGSMAALLIWMANDDLSAPDRLTS
jgi:hypothetical protein